MNRTLTRQAAVHVGRDEGSIALPMRGCLRGVPRGEGPVGEGRPPRRAGRHPGTAGGEEGRAGRACSGAGPVGMVMMAFLLSVLGVGAATLWRSDVAPAAAREVEELICRVGALITGGTCPDDPTDRPRAKTPARGGIGTGSRAMTPDGPTDCIAWLSDPFLDSDADGNRIVVAHAILHCDTKPRRMKVEAHLWRAHEFIPTREYLGGDSPPESIHTMQVIARYEYRCTTDNPRIYLATANYQIYLDTGQVATAAAETYEIPLDCD